MTFYILTEDFKGFEKGIILLEGIEANPNFTDEKGIEYFDVTTEVNEGYSYSVYGIPLDVLKPSCNDVELTDGFTAFIANNYKGTQELKELFKKRN
jgi:hypothetical protein